MTRRLLARPLWCEERRASILVGGPGDDFGRVEGVLEGVSGNVVYVGSNGMDLYAKIAVNMVLGTYVASLA